MSSSMCCADSLTPIGMPPERSRTRSAKRAEVVDASSSRGSAAGETAGVPSGRPRTSAIRPTTLWPGRWPPVPVLAPWPSLKWNACTFVEHVSSPAEPGRRELVEVAASSRPAPRAACRPRRSRCRCRRARAPRASAVFASCDSAPKLMSDTKSGMSRHSGLAAFGPDAHLGADRLVVEQREAVQLRGDELDVVPLRQLVARHAHRGDRSRGAAW